MFPTANYSLLEQDDRFMTVDYSHKPHEKRTTYSPSRGITKKNDFSSKKLYLDVLIADELVVRVSTLYSELYDEINYSKYIVDLEDDWDGEGSVGYKVSTWSSVVRFLVDYARWLFLQTGKVLYRPNIYNGKDGGIDVLWDEHKFQMLFRVDDEASNVVFYADDKNGQTSEGVFSIESANFFMIPMPVSSDSVQVMQEIIPDADTIYCRVHRTNVDSRKADIERIKPRAFDPTPYNEPDGLSVNWSKYSDAQSTKDGVAANGKNPNDFGVVSFVVEKVRGLPLRVIHKPVYEPVENKAHSLILDIPPRSANDAKKVLLLRSICKIEIDVN